MLGFSKKEKLKKDIEIRKLEMQRKQLDKSNQTNDIVYNFIEDIYSFKKSQSAWNMLKETKDEYTEYELTEMRIQASNLFRQRPLAKGLVNGIKNYIIGKGFAIEPDTLNEQALEYWKNWKKINNIDAKVEEIITRTLRDGEIFQQKFKTLTGLKYRFIDPQQIQNHANSMERSYGIYTKEGDVEEPLEYDRVFYDNKGAMQTDVIKAKDMDHFKIGVDSNVKRGLSFFVGIARYIVDYDGFLDDRTKLNKLRTFFAVIGKALGATPVSTLAGEFTDADSGKDSSKVTSDSPSKQKKKWKSGSVVFEKGIDWDLKNLNIAASDAKEDGRSILLQIAAGTNLPEFMVTGDASNANYSSTMVSESPGVKTIEHWQEYFGRIYKQMFTEVIEYGILTGKVPDSYKKTITDKEGKDKSETVDTETTVTIIYPIILHKDLLDETKAAALHRTMGIASKRTLATKFSYDYDHEKEDIAIESTEEDKRAAENAIEFYPRD